MSQAVDSSPKRARVPISGRGVATDYAVCVLEALGFGVQRSGGSADAAPNTAWAESGAMSLTGPANAAALVPDAPVASCADGAARALVALAGELFGEAPSLDGAALLGERAALGDPAPTRAGRNSVGGSARLLRCADGWLALNLARPEDRALLPAWLEADGEKSLEANVRTRNRDELVARGRLMGMAVAGATEVSDSQATWIDFRPAASRLFASKTPLVVDCSSLWAGPLCGQLLAACGARVVKLESRERPDGARRGSERFFDLLNGGKQSVALSLASNSGRRAFEALLRAADIVIEGSRPRAFGQLGIDARSIVEDRGNTWVSITGYGRRPPFCDWIAFGDDAAAAAGLIARMPDGVPVFCGDAIADPLTGLHAAVAALASWGSGGRRLLDISLVGVARSVRCFPAPVGAEPTRAEPARAEPAPPRARAIGQRAREFGADTQDVLTDLGIRC